MSLRSTFLWLLALPLLGLQGCNIDPIHTNPDTRDDPVHKADTFDHSRLDGLLKRHVGDDGLVDYRGLQGDLSELDAYLAGLGRVDPDSLSTVHEKMAYWINAYNAVTLRGILHFYPTSSIKNHAGFWTEIKTNCGGREVSLDDIEHDILRKMGDPRIHAAINCASISCPKLRNEAYTGVALNRQLEEQCRGFLADTTRNQFDDREKTVHLSKIFAWFGADFDVQTYGGVRGFVRHHSLPRREWLAGDFEFDYLDYDWGLNERKSDN